MAFIDVATAMIEGLPVASPGVNPGLWRELETLIVNEIVGAVSGGGLGPVVYEVPISGDTLTAVEDQSSFVIEPAGGLAVLHLVLPPGAPDGATFDVTTTQTITDFDAVGAAGDSMAGTSGGPFVLAENSAVAWRYRSANSTWYGKF